MPAKRIVKFKVGRMMRQKVSGDDDVDEETSELSGSALSAGGIASERAQAGSAGAD